MRNLDAAVVAAKVARKAGSAAVKGRAGVRNGLARMRRLWIGLRTSSFPSPPYRRRAKQLFQLLNLRPLRTTNRADRTMPREPAPGAGAAADAVAEAAVHPELLRVGLRKRKLTSPAARNQKRRQNPGLRRKFRPRLRSFRRRRVREPGRLRLHQRRLHLFCPVSRFRSMAQLPALKPPSRQPPRLLPSGLRAHSSHPP
jgi:hypothetical protein